MNKLLKILIRWIRSLLTGAADKGTKDTPALDDGGDSGVPNRDNDEPIEQGRKKLSVVSVNPDSVTFEAEGNILPPEQD